MKEPLPGGGAQSASEALEPQLPPDASGTGEVGGEQSASRPHVGDGGVGAQSSATPHVSSALGAQSSSPHWLLPSSAGLGDSGAHRADVHCWEASSAAESPGDVAQREEPHGLRCSSLLDRTRHRRPSHCMSSAGGEQSDSLQPAISGRVEHNDEVHGVGSGVQRSPQPAAKSARAEQMEHVWFENSYSLEMAQMSEAVTLPTGHATVALLAEAAAVASAMQSAVIIIIAIARYLLDRHASAAAPTAPTAVCAALPAAACAGCRQEGPTALRPPPSAAHSIVRQHTYRSPATRAIMLTTSLFSAAQQHQQSMSLTCIEPLDSGKPCASSDSFGLWSVFCRACGLGTLIAPR